MKTKYRSKTQTQKRKSNAGYTLTELVIVIVVLGLVAAAVTPQIIGRFRKSKSQSAFLQMQTIAAAVDMFYVDMGRYPTDAESISVLWTAPTGTTNSSAWAGPYVREQSTLIDPWGEPFIYIPPTTVLGTYQLKTLGVDKVEGGTADAADLVFPTSGSTIAGG